MKILAIFLLLVAVIGCGKVKADSSIESNFEESFLDQKQYHRPGGSWRPGRPGGIIFFPPRNVTLREVYDTSFVFCRTSYWRRTCQVSVRSPPNTHQSYSCYVRLRYQSSIKVVAQGRTVALLECNTWRCNRRETLKVPTNEVSATLQTGRRNGGFICRVQAVPATTPPPSTTTMLPNTPTKPPTPPPSTGNPPTKPPPPSTGNPSTKPPPPPPSTGNPPTKPPTARPPPITPPPTTTSGPTPTP